MTKNLSQNSIPNFLYKGEQKVSIYGAGVRQHCGKVSVVLELSQAKSVKNQGVQKVDKNRTEVVHQHFTKSSPDLEGLSLGRCRQGAGKMSAVFSPSFVLSPQIAEYMRKSPIQFAIPSSYLYGVVLKKLCL